jgi:hypothetical protein
MVEVAAKWLKCLQLPSAIHEFPSYESHDFMGSYNFHMNFDPKISYFEVVILDKIFPMSCCTPQSKVI